MGLTPMMLQYLENHEKVPDAILFYRLGDFYEMFFDDAIKASKELEIALTGRECGLEERAPMCGVPYHSAEGYIAKLIEKGYKVAICEQVEDPATAKGIVKREIVRVISPGTIIDEKSLSSKKNNYLMGVYADKNGVGIAYLDVSTGEFFATEIYGKTIKSKVIDEILKISPAEILLSPHLYKNSEFVKELETTDTMVGVLNSTYFEAKPAEKRLKEQFSVYALDALGLKEKNTAMRAVGALLRYVDETQKRILGHISHLQFYETDAFMLLDRATRRNLELTETLRSAEKKGSLLWVLDHTVTAMGGRMLRRWVETPLLNVDAITERQMRVQELVSHAATMEELKGILNKVYDLERICGKLSFGNVNPKDVLALKQSLCALPKLRDYIQSIAAPSLQALYSKSDDLRDITELIEKSISEDAPYVLKDGGVIKSGYNEEIDLLRESAKGGKNWITKFENEEREKTGIKSLKIKYNRIFGYFIEVTKTNLDQVPEHYIRKQTLANAERYFTPELKEMETKILGAGEKLIQMETQIFGDIRDQILDKTEIIQKCAGKIAATDALYSFAKAAIHGNYVKPTLTRDDVIKIEEGRHPVVEKIIGQNNFITNDTLLSNDDCRLMLITGPNMAGKSTYIRQVAIITLMAQIGSFVPAQKAEIGIVDRIFTRVGASDDLATGQSTFMVEMSEVSNILKNATKDSLVILDEIGRGTSTFDGISIAWAVAEYLWDLKTIGAKTLFATHYQELTELEDVKIGIKNFSIGVKETAEGVIFLRKIKPGCADRSYGIEVAKLAGFPSKVTDRAKEILKALEHGESNYRQEIKSKEVPEFMDAQLNFFDILPKISDEESNVLENLREIDIEEMTPIQAMNILYSMKDKLKK